MQLGARIRAWRTARGLSQQNLADEIGKTVSAVSQFESGKNDPSKKTLDKIVGALAGTETKFYGPIPSRAAVLGL